MKVLIFSNFGVGLYNFRKELIQELLNKGWSVSAALPYGESVEKLQKMGCKIIDTPLERRGSNPFKDFSLYLNYKKIIKEEKPDFIITYTIKPNIYGGIASKKYRIPYCINITGLGTAFQSDNFIKRLVIKLYKISAKNAKYILFENEGNRQEFISLGIACPEQTILNNGAGVNLDDYPFTEYPGEAETRFLFIGRVMKEKGIDELLEAAERIKAEHDNVYFDIVGPMEDNYKSIIDSYAARGVINYEGFQADVKPYIKKAHCFVLPSYHEGMANTNLECSSMGRPVITSNIHGCMEAVENGESGFLVNRADSEDLYNKLIMFIELPYEEKCRMGKSARAHMEKNFDKKDIVKNTMRIFD